MALAAAALLMLLSQSSRNPCWPELPEQVVQDDRTKRLLEEVRLFTEALARCDSAKDEIDLLMARAQAYAHLGQWEKAANDFDLVASSDSSLRCSALGQSLQAWEHASRDPPFAPRDRSLAPAMEFPLSRQAQNVVRTAQAIVRLCPVADPLVADALSRHSDVYWLHGRRAGLPPLLCRLMRDFPATRAAAQAKERLFVLRTECPE